ncbi:hypothetical protein FI667_g7782, partial [Globisporangium splendens]
MDEYRQSVLGRALADVLQELEAPPSAVDASIGDTLFSLFDEAIRAELQQPTATHKRQRTASGAPQEISTRTPPPVFTHESMELQGNVKSYNRFMDKWSVHAAIEDDDSGALRLDHVPVKLHAASSSVEMLLKLHQSLPTARASSNT